MTTETTPDLAAELARQLHCDQHQLEVYIRPALRMERIAALLEAKAIVQKCTLSPGGRYAIDLINDLRAKQ